MLFKSIIKIFCVVIVLNECVMTHLWLRLSVKMLNGTFGQFLDSLFLVNWPIIKLIISVNENNM